MKCIFCDSNNFTDFNIGAYKLRRCNTCNYVFKRNLPKPEDDPNYLNDSSGFYLQKENLSKINNDIQILEGRVEYLINKANLNKNAKILDISCGTGSFVRAARNKGYDAWGTEISKNMLDFAKSSFGNYFFDGYKGEYKKIKYDLITLFHVIEHLINPRDFFIKEVLPLLNLGGTVVIEIPNFYSFDHYALGENWPGLSLNVHHNFITTDTINYFCDKNNLVLSGVENSKSQYLDNNIKNYLTNILKLNNIYNNLLENHTGLISVFYIKRI